MRLVAFLLAVAPAGQAVAQPVPAPVVDIAAVAPAAPDYANPANWADMAASQLPQGAGPWAKTPAVDVFYLHPTSNLTDTLWNHDTADAAANRWADESAIARQASAFSGCCRIFAPRYRAATYKALRAGRMTDAFAVAYSDVERAFAWYLEHENNGRPFILVGHSQGAAHVATLVEKQIDGTPLAGKMVAAYVIGVNLAEGEFGPRFRQIKPCRKPDQTGCIVQWNTVLAGSNIDPMLAAYRKYYVDRFGESGDATPLCINPVTFDADQPAAISSQAKGAVSGEPGAGPMLALRKGAVAVQCERGIAVSYLAPGLDLKPLPGGSMHYHDVGLFWGDLRANAIVRSAAWVRKNGVRQ